MSRKQLLAYKYRIYPTEDQQVLLSKTFGCKRVIYNHYLNEQQTRYINKEKHLTKYDINKDITKLKDEMGWLREVDSIALQMSAEDISVAYDNFFKSITGKRIGQIDCHGEEIKSQAIGDLEIIIPWALQKMTSKIERSGICSSVSHGSGQARRSLVVE